MKFNLFGKGERSRETPDAFLDKARSAVAQGEYAMAVGHFRSALRLTRPEEAEEYQQKFTAIWRSIESGAIRGMGKAGVNPEEFMVEGALAINTLKNVKECNDLFGLSGLFMAPDQLKVVVTDATLKEIQNTLAPAPITAPKKV